MKKNLGTHKDFTLKEIFRSIEKNTVIILNAIAEVTPLSSAKIDNREHDSQYTDAHAILEDDGDIPLYRLNYPRAHPDRYTKNRRVKR